MMPEAPSAFAWDRLAEHFDAACALRGDAREDYVRSACSDDPMLEWELRSLLRAAAVVSDDWRPLSDAELAPVLEAATTAWDADHARPHGGARPTLTGTRVRHYEVLEPLGSGGVGVVHRGRDTRLDREVALKFLSADRWVDPASRARFEREARAVSSLDDPHICALHAIEETEDGALCLVMAYCAGGTLRDRLRAAPLDVGEAVRIASDLAAGLASAHRRRIVHGDLKPANVGFSHDGVTRILDFGLAVRLGEDGLASRDGRIGFAGTLPYAAPELLRGGLPDVRTDLWALGVVLHEMLAGYRPFAGETESALRLAILDDAPRPIVRADGAPVAPALHELVHALLAKDPAERPSSAAEVLDRLGARPAADGAASSAVTASPAPLPSPLPSPAPTPRQRRGMMLVGALGVAVLALLLRLAGGEAGGERPTTDVAPLAPPTLAVLPFAVRGDASLAYLRDGMVDLLTPAFDATGLVRGIDPNTVIGAAALTTSGVLDSATARTLARTVGAARYVVGSVVQAGDRITLRATLYGADGRESARSQVEVDSLEGILRGAESLVRHLASAELRAPGDTVGAIAAATTMSTPALRAFLDGERALRDARPAAAVEHFRAAVRADSLFALAWYRLARAARWNEVDSLSRAAADRAYVLVATLPLRLQQVVRSYHALRFGSPVEAERGFRQIVTDYPSDVEGWMLLGETLFHNYPMQGRSAQEATDAFQRVMALDPRNREITVYLMELAARADRRGPLDTLFSMYFSPNSAGEQPGIRETFLALHARRVRGVEQAITDPFSAHTALRRVGSRPEDQRAARRFAEVLTAPSVSPSLRLDGWLALASLATASAQPDEAERAWREAAAIDAPTVELHRAMTLSASDTPFSADSVRALRARLERATDAGGSPDLSRAEWAQVRRYLAGLLSARLDDTSGVQQARDRLRPAREGDRLARPLREALEAHLRARRGDWSGALTALAASDVGLPAVLRRRVPSLAQYSERRLHADVLRALGRGDEAARWEAGLRDEPGVWGLPYLARGTD